MPHSIHPAFYYRQTSPSGIFSPSSSGIFSPSSSSHLFDHHYSYMNYVAAAFSFVTPLVISPPPTSPTPPSTSPATLGAWSICSCYSWCLVYLLLLSRPPHKACPRCQSLLPGDPRRGRSNSSRREQDLQNKSRPKENVPTTPPPPPKSLKVFSPDISDKSQAGLSALLCLPVQTTGKSPCQGLQTGVYRRSQEVPGGPRGSQGSQQGAAYPPGALARQHYTCTCFLSPLLQPPFFPPCGAELQHLVASGATMVPPWWHLKRQKLTSLE